MVVPTYWGPTQTIDSTECKIFDHPAALNCQSTLHSLLNSLEILKDRDFCLVIIIVSTLSEIEKECKEQIVEIIFPYLAKYEIKIFDANSLKRLKAHLLKSNVSKEACDFINLNNYPSVRNICSLAGILNGSEITIFIDDDEVFNDPDFMHKARDFIGKDIKGEKIHAVAGYYMQQNGGYKINEKNVPKWRKKYWNNVAAMNQAFHITIGKPPRLKPTSFVFGGNMVLDKDALIKVPFDPMITRGEDIDFLINLRIFGIKFWLDRELYIKHIPPKTSNPFWKSVREDLRRFLYERKKIVDHGNVSGISQKDLMPYPGVFLGPDLEERIIKTNQLLFAEYKNSGDLMGMKECQKNIDIVSNNEFADFNTVDWLNKITAHWQEISKTAFGKGLDW